MILLFSGFFLISFVPGELQPLSMIILLLPLVFLLTGSPFLLSSASLAHRAEPNPRITPAKFCPLAAPGSHCSSWCGFHLIIRPPHLLACLSALLCVEGLGFSTQGAPSLAWSLRHNHTLNRRLTSMLHYASISATFLGNYYQNNSCVKPYEYRGHIDYVWRMFYYKCSTNIEPIRYDYMNNQESP